MRLLSENVVLKFWFQESLRLLLGLLNRDQRFEHGLVRRKSGLARPNVHGALGAILLARDLRAGDTDLLGFQW